MPHAADDRWYRALDGLFLAFRSRRCERFVVRVADAFTSEGG